MTGMGGEGIGEGESDEGVVGGGVGGVMRAKEEREGEGEGDQGRGREVKGNMRVRVRG